MQLAIANEANGYHSDIQWIFKRNNMMKSKLSAMWRFIVLSLCTRQFFVRSVIPNLGAQGK